MKKTLFVASLCLASTGLAIGLYPASLSAKTPLVVQQPASDLSVPAIDSKRPQVELVNPGVEPRQQLRLKPSLGVKQTTTMIVKMEMEVSTAGRSTNVNKVPTMLLTINTQATKIDANGDIHYDFSYANADIAADTPNLPTAALDSMRSAVKKLVGLKGSFIMDSQGGNKGGSFTLPAEADNNFKQMVQNMSKSLHQLASPLPAEAVGKGAKWRISFPSNAGGMNVNQTAIYELIGLQDGVATLKTSVEQQANPQNLTLPQLPAGSTMAIKSFVSQGQGEVIMRLDQLMPVRSVVSINSNSEMTIKVAGNPKELTMKTKMLMEMTLDSK
ncbi:hypothetical protein K4039_10115 [Lyngbya sp. CCAP 1446/10]|uniref:hypothetical protein n=1 Tax=Lyngbya sp. CCAP 1446/10 TaxID=439293 RepID=UPI002237AB82|nr:hypothetical protein [Lyngbya sp. CCAP 1446/10]MCW6050433.1 hypothetical protein [Lyngbya sp. CCAP 1446/10]